MFWYRECLNKALKRKKNSLNTSPVVFYGSSSIRLWSSLSRDMTPFRTLNLGFGGATLGACCWFFNELLAGVSPRALVVYAGENDLGDGRHPEEVINHYRLLAYDWKNRFPKTPMFFISLKYSPEKAHLSKSIHYTNLKVRELCESDPICEFINVTEMMKGPDGEVDKSLFAPDEIHLNEKGYEIWSEVVKAHLSFSLGNSEVT